MTDKQGFFNTLNMKGWIKLRRSLSEWEWYDDPNTLRVLIHLLITANYERKQWRGITINPGELITSYDHLGEILGLSRQQVKTALKKIEASGEITRVRTRNKLHIRLIKWAKMQSEEEASNPNETPAATREEPEDNLEITPTKEIKNNKEDKELKLKLFAQFWDLYNKKRDRRKAEQKWLRLDIETMNKIIAYVPDYVKSTPEVKFRKDPCTFLNNESWENEIINTDDNGKDKHPSNSFRRSEEAGNFEWDY